MWMNKCDSTIALAIYPCFVHRMAHTVHLLLHFIYREAFMLDSSFVYRFYCLHKYPITISMPFIVDANNGMETRTQFV